jgi:predicted nuclease of predicted toxin-antitoxin system
MARFYADEQFPFQVVELLRNLGHDVLTVQEAGNANQRIPDDQVLAFAVNQERSILTINRVDFIRLHRRNNEHFGIVVCTNNRNWEQFAARVDDAVKAEESLRGKLIRVLRPSVEISDRLVIC